MNYKHGGKRTRLYRIWKNIKNRCLNLNDKEKFKYYGGRGIIICPEWANDYTKFRDWSLSNGYREGLEIDREDNNGNYEPSNCRWVTRTINVRNRDCCKIKSIEMANEIRKLYKTNKYTQKELGKLYNMSQANIHDIIHHKIWD